MNRKLLRTLFVLLIFIILLLIGEGVYYFFVLNKSTLKFTGGNVYKEGIRFFQRQKNGESSLISIYSTIKSIDKINKSVFLEDKISSEDVKINCQEDDLFFLTIDKNPVDLEEISFDNLQIGDVVSYSPQIIERNQPAVWVIER